MCKLKKTEFIYYSKCGILCCIGGGNQEMVIEEEIEIKVTTPTKTYKRSRSDITELVFTSPSSTFNTPQRKKVQDIINMPSPTSIVDENDTPKKKKLKTKIDQQRIKLRNKSTQICKLKRSVSRFGTRNTLRNLMLLYEFPSKNSGVIVTMQLRNKKIPWTLEEKYLALTLYYKSLSAYKYLRLQNIKLPGPSTIRKWISQSKFLPGLSLSFLSHIKKKFDGKSEKEKIYTISFDEIYIKEFLEYSKGYDFIEGSEDFGKYGRSNKSANSVMVFMARGIFYQWKFPVAYFLTHSGVKTKMLNKLIINIIIELFNVGLCPKMSVCDQGTNNQSALKSLGIDENKPYFYVNKNRVFSIFDVPHLVKSLRNNFIDCFFKKGDLQFAFKDIVEVYQIDKKNTKSKAILKITEAHIIPENES